MPTNEQEQESVHAGGLPIDYKEPEADEPMPEPKQTRRRGPSSKKKELHEKRVAAGHKSITSRDKEIDEWLATFDWDQVGMQCVLKRLAPGQLKGIQLRGTLEIRKHAPIIEEEVLSRFGGGTYEMFVSGPGDDGRARAMGRKKFEIGGAPKMVAPEHVGAEGGILPGAGGPSLEQLASGAQTGIVGLLDKTIDRTLNQVPEAQNMNPDVLNQLRQSFESNLQVTLAASARENDTLKAQLNELRQTTEALRAEKSQLEAARTAEVSQAKTEASQFVGHILPQFADQQNQQTQRAIDSAREQVARFQEQFARDLQGERQAMQQQLDNAKTMYESNLINQQTLMQGQIQNLQGQLQLAQAKAEAYEGQITMLRDQLMNLHQEAARKQDPMQRMQEMSALTDFAKEIAGAGGGEDELEGLGPLGKVAMKALPAVNNVLELAMGQRAGAAPPPMMGQPMPQQPGMPMPQQLPPGAVMVRPPQPQAAPQPQQAQPRPRPAKPSRKRKGTAIKKEDLEMGIALLNGAIGARTSPERAADAAANQMDRKVLNELISRKPEAVINSLSAAGLLEGAVATAEGRQYVEAFLIALRHRIHGNLPKPETAPAPAAEPPPVPEDIEEETADDEEERLQNGLKERVEE